MTYPVYPDCFGEYGMICDDAACEVCEWAFECEQASEEYDEYEDICPLWLGAIDPDEPKGDCNGGGGECILPDDPREWRNCEFFKKSSAECGCVDEDG